MFIFTQNFVDALRDTPLYNEICIFFFYFEPSCKRLSTRGARQSIVWIPILNQRNATGKDGLGLFGKPRSLSCYLNKLNGMVHYTTEWW